MGSPRLKPRRLRSNFNIMPETEVETQPPPASEPVKEEAVKEEAKEEKKEKKKKVKEPAPPPPPPVHKKDFEKDVVYVYQFNRTKCVPSISPACLKVETWL